MGNGLHRLQVEIAMRGNKYRTFISFFLNILLPLTKTSTFSIIGFP